MNNIIKKNLALLAIVVGTSAVYAATQQHYDFSDQSLSNSAVRTTTAKCKPNPSHCEESIIKAPPKVIGGGSGSIDYSKYSQTTEMIQTLTMTASSTIYTQLCCDLNLHIGIKDGTTEINARTLSCDTPNTDASIIRAFNLITHVEEANCQLIAFISKCKTTSVKVPSYVDNSDDSDSDRGCKNKIKTTNNCKDITKKTQM